MKPLYFVAVLSLLCFMVLRCTGTYYFYVELQSFNNPGNEDYDGGCCDVGCGSCDNYFILCLRQPGYNVYDDFCPYGSFSTSSDPDSGSALTFTTGPNALATHVPNPLEYAGNTWPGGFQLKIRAVDADADTDDPIDTWIIEVPTLLPTSEWSDFTPYTGTTSNNAQITLRYRLRCRGNWHGHNCNIRCVDVNTDSAHLECALDGSHVCMDGWQDLSTDCTVPVCQEGCHPTGGTCDNPGECNCEPGWSGDLCDECSPRVGCEHGYCTHPNDCTCDEGYDGTLCNIDLDPCSHQTPCIYGVCSNVGADLYSCSCDAGYAGPNCEMDIDDCSPNPCLNGGTCEDLINGFVCTCTMGWTGDTCGENIDECEELSPCKNGSTCSDCTPTVPIINVDATPVLDCTLGYTCQCLPGFYGDNCNLDIDHCNPNQCMNGGICHDGVLDYTCNCLPGYTGINCEDDFDYCQELQPCLNGATCMNLNTTELYRCECAAGFTGPNCGINIDDCPNNSCVVTSTRACVDGVQVYTCDCLRGYSGTFCEVDIDECEMFRCLNGGTCEDRVADFSCTCPELFTGKECEEPIDGDQCLSSPCLNGGTCIDEVLGFKCQCPSNYKGLNCNEVSPPGPPTDPCGNITCKEGETCVVIETDHKCVPCDNGLAGCDEEIAAQSDDENSSNSNTPAIIGSTVAAVVILLLVLLLLVLLCCCRPLLLLICPCLGREKVEENEVLGTLSGPVNSVTHNAMYMGADTLLSGTLTKNGTMQNPMYAAPGGVKSDSLSKVPLQFASNGSAVPNPTYTPPRLNGHSPSKYQNIPAAGKAALADLEDEVDHPYAELEPLQVKMGTITAGYQKLSETTEGGVASSRPYASLYSTPSVTSNSLPTLPPPRPPHYMPLMGSTRPENPYVLGPRPDTSVAETSPEMDEVSDDDVKLANSKSP